jgi:hypothetical protein
MLEDYDGVFKQKRPVPVAPFCVSTYVSIAATCPSTCPFIDGGGCYVETGFTKRSAADMDAIAHENYMSGLDVIREEARLIRWLFAGGPVPQDGARGGRDLRLHVGGDCGTATGARLLAREAETWRLRGGGSVWTFTHHWRRVKRAAWGRVSVLASVEHGSDFAAARAQGYAPAIVLPAFSSERAFTVPGGGTTKVIPCPAETRGTTCVECRLCLDRDLLAMNAAIGFSVHGAGAVAAREKLVQIGRSR